jgi:hypothetical protein
MAILVTCQGRFAATCKQYIVSSNTPRDWRMHRNFMSGWRMNLLCSRSSSIAILPLANTVMTVEPPKAK